jgi:hypothetical protein
MECDDGVEAVKNRYPNGIPAAFLQSAFPELYRYRTRKSRHPLALSGLRRYISASFPDKACGSA